MDMTPLAAGTFAKVLAGATGQELPAGRRWRIETALGPILRTHGLDTLDQLACRIGRPEEIVSTALYLASPASSYTTGAIIRVDGGVL